ncbi:MAG: electron transfer flavoprotein subunit beta/FixA family protein [Candidatus Hydrogenedentes bacterium]|nr:electron transfer flavoprotein subunit beta/FixA family protein [Candidatus Hydrogenedentota bacterium]
MKIAVLMKRVPDTASVFKIGADNKSVETDNLKYVMSPYDEHALEEAIQTKEAGKADEVFVITVGPDAAKETIRTALAMGADRAVFVKDDAASDTNCKGTAMILAAALKTEAPELIFAGKQAVDDDASQVPERVAELLDIPHASVVTSFELNDGTALVEREIEGGHYKMEMALPALFTTQKGINTPRYPTLPNIMKAKKKEIKELTFADIGLSAADVASGVTIEEMALPRQDRLNKILDGDNDERVAQLLSVLREEEKVL